MGHEAWAVSHDVLEGIGGGRQEEMREKKEKEEGKKREGIEKREEKS